MAMKQGLLYLGLYLLCLQTILVNAVVSFAQRNEGWEHVEREIRSDRFDETEDR